MLAGAQAKLSGSARKASTGLPGMTLALVPWMTNPTHEASTIDRTVQDAGHAWAEAYVQGLGWVGFDIPNEVCPDERYVRVATGADTREAAPVTGIHYGGAEETLNVELAVTSQRMEQ